MRQKKKNPAEIDLDLLSARAKDEILAQILDVDGDGDVETDDIEDLTGYDFELADANVDFADLDDEDFESLLVANFGDALQRRVNKRQEDRVARAKLLAALQNPADPTGTATERVTTYWRTPRFKRGRQWLEDNLGQMRLFNYNPSKVSVQKIGKQFGVMIDSQLYKLFNAKTDATNFVQSLKTRADKAKKNPLWLSNLSQGLGALASAAAIRDHLQNRKKKSTKKKSNRPRSNPHGDIYREFTGLEPTEATEMIVSHLAPDKLDKLGDLVEIRLTDGRRLQFNPNSRKHKVWLTAANKQKMWITGTRIAKPNPDLADHEIEPLGEIDSIVYHAFKPVVGDQKPEFYIHELGEFSGAKPILAADKEGFPVIYGGNYTIESRGIVD
jgi:hypothetical protein